MFFFCLSAANSTVFAQVKLARLFSDHVVLQRQKPIPVWGWAQANEAVNVSLGNQKKSAIADGNGKWKVEFAPMEAGGPFEIDGFGKIGLVERERCLDRRSLALLRSIKYGMDCKAI